MIDALVKNSEIAGFLEKYPKRSWFKCIETIVVFGIREIQDKISGNLTLEQLLECNKKRPRNEDIKFKLDMIKQEIENMSPGARQLTDRPVQRKAASTIRCSVKRPPQPTLNLKTVKEAKRPSPSRAQTSRHSVERKIPSYLKNVQSRIGDDVQKDIEKHRKDHSIRDDRESYEDTPRRQELSQEPRKCEELPKRHDSDRPKFRFEEREYTPKRQEQTEKNWKADSTSRSLVSKQEDLHRGTSMRHESSEQGHFNKEELDVIQPRKIEVAADNYRRETQQFEERYNLPRQITTKTPPRPPAKCAFIEPKTCDPSEVSHLLSRSKPQSLRNSKSSEPGELVRIAEHFLTDPYMNQLYKADSRLSIPASPKNLEQWLSSKEHLLDSFDAFSP